MLYTYVQYIPVHIWFRVMSNFEYLWSQVLRACLVFRELEVAVGVEAEEVAAAISAQSAQGTIMMVETVQLLFQFNILYCI